MTGAFVIIFASFLFSLIAVALILRLSHRNSWYDHVNERKIHTGDIPRLGGMGFASTFIIFALVINFSAAESGFGLRFLPCLGGMVLVLATGVFDDFRPLAPRYKLVIQIIAALCVIFSGYTFRRILHFGAGLPPGPGAVRYVLTFFWIVGLTNAVNFIDGVDGLAGGVSLLAVIGFALIFASFAGVRFTMLVCFCLAAALLGFLVFNAPFPRARIFMGDGGSQFLGFVLALIPLAGKGDLTTELPALNAAALLAIPIFDTVSAVWRRIRDGRRIDSPDKAHIHHKLMTLGLSVRGVDALLFGVQIVLVTLVYLSVRLRGPLSLVCLGLAYASVTILFGVVHFVNRNLYRRGLAAAGAETSEDAAAGAAEG
ncbi:MAG: undecaprenyl/decaprenyl-phosphate alpha-N-acetylglucosaminyl 1-phosphate transferase [Treponema sp.]|jgi:UDP-GlcNAc:undecaprenyl-phosphate GlcNAc-1-phosphate transferase|nr:undecaprenyl/decaprenyl-phosphate alpha-N-acetylglucosaminyl 1-phosphate transferase [Treponema sp.]